MRKHFLLCEFVLHRFPVYLQDEKVAINPITDCMLSCGHYACSRGDIEEDMGHGQVPVMQLYVPQNEWQFATLGSLASFEETNSSFS